MLAQIGPAQLLIILGMVVLLFGGRKLPELARGSGHALRIFRSEIQASNADDAELVAGKKADGPEPGPSAGAQPHHQRPDRG